MRSKKRIYCDFKNNFVSLAKIKSGASKTGCIKMLQEIEKQVECENESVMLGLSPKSRRDLEMAATILQEYAETMLNPET